MALFLKKMLNFLGKIPFCHSERSEESTNFKQKCLEFMDSSPALLAQNDKIKEPFIYQNSAFYTKFRPKIQLKPKFSQS